VFWDAWALLILLTLYIIDWEPASGTTYRETHHAYREQARMGSRHALERPLHSGYPTKFVQPLPQFYILHCVQFNLLLIRSSNSESPTKARLEADLHLDLAKMSIRGKFCACITLSKGWCGLSHCNGSLKQFSDTKLCSHQSVKHPLTYQMKDVITIANHCK
jgi:hypothetical protein